MGEQAVGFFQRDRLDAFIHGFSVTSAVRLVINIHAEGVQLTHQPKKWIAAVLGFIAPLLAFLYVERPRLAALIFASQLVLAVASFTLPGTEVFGVVQFAFSVFCAAYAYRLAGRVGGGAARPWYARWYGLAGILAVCVVLAVGLRAFIVEPFFAPSTSMAPSVPVKSQLLVQKWGYGHYSTYGITVASRPPALVPARGDVIAFDYPHDPSQTYVKRVVGVPGDLIEYRDKRVLINGVDTRGRRLDDYLDQDRLKFLERYRERLGTSEHDIVIQPDAPAIVHEMQTALPGTCISAKQALRCKVPAGAYFVMGDNRDNSRDSRYWGFVQSSAVVGKVIAIFPPG